MENIIETIHIGVGQGAGYFSTLQNTSHQLKADEIKEETKQISENVRITVYRGYVNGKLKFEVEANNGITLIFKH